MTGTAGKVSFRGLAPVDVGAADVNVKVSVKPFPSVSGTVQLKNPEAKPKGSIMVSLLFEKSGGGIATAVRPDGTFLFPAVSPERYRIAIRGTDGYFASDIHVDGAAYANGVVDLLEGESVTLRLVASNETGRLRGFVMNGEQPLEGALVVLAPATPTSDWLAYGGFQTDSDGSYDFRNMPAGDYLLFAVDDVGLEYTNPEILRRYVPSAKRVRIEAFGTGSERLSIVNAEQGRPGGLPH